MRHLAIFTIIILFNSVLRLSARPATDSIQYGKLYLEIRTIGFIKNNEYFNPIQASEFVLPSSLPQRVDKSIWLEGYTLTGTFFQPELVYRATPDITIKGGVHLLRYSGSNGFRTARPLISATYDFSGKSNLTIGSFSSENRHRFFDPLFNRERLYTNNPEEGLLYTYRSERIFNDTWIDWENFIFKGDTVREVFNFGESFRYALKIIPGVLDAELPLQIMFRHYGGQISDAPYSVETFFNMATGIRLNYSIGKRFGRLSAEYLYFRNSVIPQRESYALRHGDATWLRLHYELKRLYFGAYYWKAEDFYAPSGNEIYASIFNFRSDYVLHTRKVLTNAFYYTLIPESYFELQFGAESYYDINAERLDYALLLHLSFNKLFKLAAVR